MTSEREHLEQEIEASRLRLEEHLASLGSKLTPSALADSALGLVRDAPYGTMLAGGLSLLRQHPVPTGIATVGLGWLAYKVARGLSASSSETVTPPKDEISQSSSSSAAEDDLSAPLAPPSLKLVDRRLENG